MTYWVLKCEEISEPTYICPDDFCAFGIGSRDERIMFTNRDHAKKFLKLFKEFFPDSFRDVVVVKVSDRGESEE